MENLRHFRVKFLSWACGREKITNLESLHPTSPVEVGRPDTLSGLVPELLLSIADFLPVEDIYCLPLCNHRLFKTFENKTRRKPLENKSRLSFLRRLEWDKNENPHPKKPTMPTPEDINRVEDHNNSNPGPSLEPTIDTRESTQNRTDNTHRADATRHTEIYTDNLGHASRLTDEERQRLDALAAESRGGAIFVTHDLVHRIDTLMADGTRRTDEALMQYLFQDDIWEAVDAGDINDRETWVDSSRNRNGNGRQRGESELRLTNGTEEGHEEEPKQQDDG
ncbi:unnamed protein product [Penicillium glandicola]